MCKWRIANHCVSINDPKTHCGKHFFSRPIDPWFVLTLGKLAAVGRAGRGGVGGWGGGGVLSQASDRSTGFISCHTFRVILSCFNFRAG